MIQLIYGHEFDRCEINLACIFTKHSKKSTRNTLKFDNIDGDNKTSKKH